MNFLICQLLVGYTLMPHSHLYTYKHIHSHASAYNTILSYCSYYIEVGRLLLVIAILTLITMEVLFFIHFSVCFWNTNGVSSQPAFLWPSVVSWNTYEIHTYVYNYSKIHRNTSEIYANTIKYIKNCESELHIVWFQ